jgi:activator of HSP90 ATPase
MKTKSIRQSVTFKAGPHAVYEALLDSRQHSKFTSSKVSMSRKVGGRFSVYDGGLSGTNLELVKDKKIVQSWRANDWPEGHYSKAAFALAKVAGGTRLTFTQSGVPLDHYEGIKQGWHDYYWKPMKAMLEPNKK